MQIFEGTVRQLLPPHCCFLCEQESDEEYIDCMREFSADVPHKMNGHKYVCAGCVDQMAGLLGYERGVEVKRAQALVEEMNQRYVVLTTHLRDSVPLVLNERESLPVPEKMRVQRRRPLVEGS